MASRKKDDPEKLAKYREIRDFGVSPEPSGHEAAGERTAPAGDTRSGSFVVHMHSATRLHYDLRLERGGVLQSFAVPHGPTLDPDAKTLAIETEDHPLEYTDYEGVIPEGNYGAGPMICWDRGEVRYLETTAGQGHDDGKIDFVLTGYKLRGRFALVRLKKSESGKEWLLIKKKDAFATADSDVKITQPLSVLSGLGIDELARATEMAQHAEDTARALGATAGNVNGRKLKPMLCGTSDDGVIPEGDYVFELKLDGVRIIADKSGTDVALTYRSGRDTTDAYPEIAVALRAIAAERMVLDGEVVAFDESGAPSFQRLLTRVHRSERTLLRGALHVPIFFVVFDVLALGKYDLRTLPWESRRKVLAELVRGKGIVRSLDYLEGHGRELLEFCRSRHLEGIVAKRRNAPYREGPKRTADWLKIKCERDESFVVVGYTVGKGRTRLGALYFATYDGKRLVARGKAGSGIDEATVDLLLEKMKPLFTKDKPYEGDPGDAPLGRTFVKPEIVVTVRFLGWSDEGSLRFPVFRGIDVDRTPQDCTVSPHGAEPAPDTSDDAPRSVSVPKKRVSLTNQTKVFWPKEGLTKGDLCRYYEAIAPAMLPFLRDRPVVLVRYPDGIEGKSFFQWNVPFGFPSWIRHVGLDEAETHGTKKRVFLVNDVDALLAVANLGAIPIHVLASREKSLDRCDFCTIDFDVDRSSLENGVRLAKTLREILDAIGLVGFPKTSGQLGLHVLIPLGQNVTFETAQLLNVLLGRLVTDRHKDIATLETSIERRGARVYVDIGQTGRRRTIVAPYSVRAFAGGRVSTPLDWDELDDLDPSRFTMKTVPERVGQHGDPMRSMLDQAPAIALAIEKLAPLVH
ncbi:DNA ligase D [soil metagenome]